MEKNSSKTKLGLELPTDPRWVDMAEMQLEDILTDHAYCEQKAATNCISLIQRYPDRERLVEEVAPVVTEEWEHFRMVLAELKKRNLKLGRQRKDLYVNELMKFQRNGFGRDIQLLEKLMISALIEARSCERFRLLSLHMKEEAMRDFYHLFMVSEAGHYKMFLSLAKEYFGEDQTMTRWREYLSYEKEIMQHLETDGSRMH